MADVKWVEVGTIYCEQLQETVELREKRVYPKGLLDMGQGDYRVVTHKCSAGFKCTHMENPCVWVDDPDGDGRQYNR